MLRVISVSRGKKVEVKINVSSIIREVTLHALVIGLIGVASLWLLRI
jgi:hypothetical protein